MKAVILAGGYGTRISEESVSRPKPMIEIGGRPILWHIMKICSYHGIKEFIICCGYKAIVIKDYFENFRLHNGDLIVDFAKQHITYQLRDMEDWKVSVIDTGLDTMTGGRLLRIRDRIGEEPFLFTYGDGLADVDIRKLKEFHGASGNLVTLTGVQPPGRFGALDISNGDEVRAFNEKPVGDGSWVNGGFFIVDPKAINYIDSENMPWESDPLSNLAKDGKLGVYKHYGFWHPMDTLRDLRFLSEQWDNHCAGWKIWE